MNSYYVNTYSQNSNTMSTNTCTPPKSQFFIDLIILLHFIMNQYIMKFAGNQNIHSAITSDLG